MILITGATGTIGSEMVRQFVAQGTPIRVLVRDPQKAASARQPGVEVAVGDLAAPASLDAALRGIDRVYLLSPSAPNQVALQGNMVEAAKRAGVRHLVKLSGAGAGPDHPSRFARWHGEIEAHIRQSGVPFTFIQAIFFMQDYLPFARTIATESRFAMPLAPDLRYNMVDSRDLAAISVAVLSQDGHQGKTYVSTGPALLSSQDAAATLSAVLGRAIAYVQIPPEQLKQGMLHAGQPEWLADGVLELYASMDTVVTDAIERVTGVPARGFAQFAADHAQVFAQGGTGHD